METINTNTDNVGKKREWIIEDKTIYCLHKSGRYTKGEPELCNEFYFSIQPDYGRGITDEMAAEQAKIIHSSIVNHHALVEALKNFVNGIDIIVDGLKDGERLNCYKSLQNSLTYKNAKELLNNIK